MTAEWSAFQDGLAYGGYAAWEAMQDHAGQDRLVPVFLRLKQVAGQSLTYAITAVLALPDLMLSQHERDLLETERTLAPFGWPHEVRCVAYTMRRNLGALPPCVEVIEVGPAINTPMPAVGVSGAPIPPSTGVGGVPVLAVIDDGIAFLNARFRATPQTTRIKALWLQSAEVLGADPRQASPDMICGRVLTETDINAMITVGGPEAAMYRQVNAALLPRGEKASSNHRVSHGTHVLDLAAGADLAISEPLLAVPILAVQLPSAALRETAGRRLEGYLVQGLRWIMTQSLRQAAGGQMPPLVISLSIGSLAGPGDGTEFLADWIRYEIGRHGRMAPGADLRIVAAHGNARRARLSARAELRRTAPFSLDWRVLPDDHSASFLEIRVDKGRSRGLKMCLTPPKGANFAPLDIVWPEKGEGIRLMQNGATLAAVSSHEQGNQSLLHFALAPTAGLDGGTKSAPGLWKIDLSTSGAEPLRVTARVQRDDTPAGYKTYGRQSWLDHPNGWNWDEETRDYTAPQPATQSSDCPVTRQGTAVAFAGVGHPSVYLVGAARPETGNSAIARATIYTAKAVTDFRYPDEPEGPSLAALGDDGMMLGGRRATGVLTGSVTRLSGTSMAAPSVARALLHYFLTIRIADRNGKAEWKALLGHEPGADISPTLGYGVLAEQPAAKTLLS